MSTLRPLESAASESLERLLGELLGRARAAAGVLGRPCLLGVSGLQGSGKSTLARRLVDIGGSGVVAVSLDDFYLPRAARLGLARGRHPLFATRGVPGTHELALLGDSLDALALASPARPARLPRFDKGQDDRAAPIAWQRIARPPFLIVLEGWCVGVPPEAEAALHAPVNRLERDEDPDGGWRRAVNEQLAGPYARLWRRLDHLLVLQAPSFEVVAGWRDQQEQALRAAAAPRAMDRSALARFLAHYERLSRHALTSLPSRADSLVRLDEQRCVRAVLWRGPGPAGQGGVFARRVAAT